MQKFNLRVYGLLLNESDEILISHESRANLNMTKFPGGGLEWGEGIKAALKREFKEELNVEIEVNDCFYLTDVFQVSQFNENDQLISIYYWVKEIKHNLPKKDFTIGDIQFSWQKVRALKTDDFTFPLDRLVVEKIIKTNNT